MIVPNPDEFIASRSAQETVKEGIAVTHSVSGHVVLSSSVELVVTKAVTQGSSGQLPPMRRLAARERRLAGSVKISYTITLPADKSIQEAVKQRAEESTADDLTEAIQTVVTKVFGPNYVIAVTSKEVPVVVAAQPTTTGPATTTREGQTGAPETAGATGTAPGLSFGAALVLAAFIRRM